MHKYRNSTDFRKALEQRLQTQAKETGQSLQKLRLYVAFEAYLARLFTVSPKDWALKGALLLEYRFDLQSRTTIDMDLQRLTTSKQLLENLIEASQNKRPDFFEFSLPREVPLNTESDTRRFKMTASVDNREFARLQIDVGTTSITNQPSEAITIPSLISFLDLPSTNILGITLSFHIAEKIHAYVQPRPRKNTRVKDFIDLQLILNNNPPTPKEITQAIVSVFSNYPEQIPPNFPSPPTEWTTSYAAQAKLYDLPSKLKEGHNSIAQKLDPILKKAARLELKDEG